MAAQGDRRRTRRWIIRAALAAGLAAASFPSGASAAAPTASDFTCSHFNVSGWQDNAAPPSTTEPFSLDGTGDCVALGKRYPATGISLSGTAVIDCRSISVEGTVTFSAGTNPSVSTNASLEIDGTDSGSTGTISLDPGQAGPIAAVMTGYVLQPRHFCDPDNEPIQLAIDGALGPSAATAAGVAQAAGGWITYNEGYKLANSAVSLVAGVRQTDGTCEPPDTTVSLTPGQPATDVREVAFNPGLCQFKIERGTPPASELAKDNKLDPAYSTDSASVGVACSVFKSHSWGYLRSWWEDPFGIDVNVVRNNTDWHWDFVQICPPVVGKRYYGWYSPTGWQLMENHWTNTWDTNQTTSSSYVRFRNGRFCYPGTVNTTYDRNGAYGQKDGNLFVRVHSVTKGPGCIYLLHFHHRAIAYTG